MKAWFEQLADREQMVLGIGAVLAAIIVAWGFVWRPLSNGAVQLRESVTEKSRFVIDLRRAEHLGPALQATGAVAPNQSLVVLVDSTARPFALDGAFTRRRPDGPNAISVSFERAPFDQLVAWLVELEESYGTAVEQLSVAGSRDPGLVSGQVSLRRQ